MLMLSFLPWYAWIAIVAIICGSLTSIAKMLIKHRERMERIRHGDDYIDTED